MKARHRKKIITEMIHHDVGFEADCNSTLDSSLQKLEKLGYLQCHWSDFVLRHYRLTDKGIQGILKKL